MTIWSSISMLGSALMMSVCRTNIRLQQSLVAITRISLRDYIV